MDFSQNEMNNNKYMGGYFCIRDNILFTTTATIPLENVSKIWISNVAKRVKLNSAFWICAVLGVFGLIISNSLSNGFFSSAGDDLILPSFLLLCAAAGFLIYYIAINTTNEYGLCIESNSGSIEIYTNYNRQILDNAQSQLEAGIMALKKGTTYNITYDLSTGQISNDIIIHGTNYGSAITGQGNTATK